MIALAEVIDVVGVMDAVEMFEVERAVLDIVVNSFEEVIIAPVEGGDVLLVKELAKVIKVEEAILDIVGNPVVEMLVILEEGDVVFLVVVIKVEGAALDTVPF